ncbi:MAG: arginine--tRNA ligase [Treponema sp.]|uniref:arginine--tRNA ligase n=1 Tax=Treponema sp. TaxID=166 RepID=UPI001DAEB336|nr:arginine--tRNA ligase [Treponema sp.]MBS7240923.1 arginine--tRNA ligase [Treponema sp.]
MTDQKEIFKSIVVKAIEQHKSEKAPEAEINVDSVRVEIPPKPEMGDLGIPMFAFAKEFHSSPMAIANDVAVLMKGYAESDSAVASLGEFLAAGPYVNLKLNKANASLDILRAVINQKENYGSLNAEGKKHLEGRRVMIEFSSPNTNKPLHLGHLRNDALGESVSRILKKAGAEVFKVDLINNRGVHICKSMLAYKLFHEAKGETPESLGMKGDHFVGQCYVEFDRHSKEHPEALQEAEDMLIKWEAGDPEVRALWQKMNDWTLGGVKETYRRTGIEFDKFYLESETYLKGKDEILKGLEKGVFFKAEDGSIRIDVTDVVGKGKDEDNHEKVLLRKDGTSVYITQDIGTAISRHDDWAFNEMIYVVASEQNYHFKILFHILKKLGFDWTDKLYHLSYGLVNLPSGRMKSREGTVVDADDLIDNLHADALKAIADRERDVELDADDVAEKVALSALHYYLLNVAPVKDMLFNPEESLSFNGNTGPYLQYMGARISSILRKAKEAGVEPDTSDEALVMLNTESEWALIKDLERYPAVVARSADTMDPSIMAAYVYDVCKSFSGFYRDCPILSVEAEQPKLARARLALAECTLTVLKTAMELVLVPFVERM